MIRLSILIPVLNEEKTVEKSIQNILDMNLKDYEVIIIDNGSNDRSVDIIKKYKKFNNFKLFIFARLLHSVKDKIFELGPSNSLSLLKKKFSK